MSLNHPFFYFFLAVVAAVLAAWASATSDKKGALRWRTLRVVANPLLVTLSAWAIWQGQERVTQRWNSQVVFEASADKEKKLILQNLGQVGIVDVRIYATVYTLKAHLDEANHLIFDGLKDFSKIGGGPFGGALTALPSISPGDTETVDLAKFQHLLPFYDFDDVMRKTMHDAFLQHYCLRITFRNTITKKRHAYYLLVSPIKGTGLPDMIDSGEIGSIGGPFDMKFFKYRAEIRKHQAELFDEAEDHLFRDKEAR